MAEETALAIAQEYPQSKYNLLIPIKTLQELSPLHKLVVNEVQISSEEKDKDCYKEKNGEYALTKKCLMKLMAAANIQVVDSHPVPTQKCNKCYEMARATKMAPKCFECPYQDDVAFQVTVAVPEPSGTFRLVKATKEIRMADAEQSMTAAQFKAFKPFRTEQCESKALNRALREGLMIKSTYKADELKKPFVVGLVMPNMADPDLKKAMIERISNNAAALYGSPAVAQIPAGQTAAALPESNMTVIDVDEPDVDFETGEVNSGTVTIDAEIVPPDNDTPPEAWINCEGDDCGGVLEPFRDAQDNEWLPERWAEYTKKLTGRVLCVKCFLKWQKEQKAAKAGGK